jgi:hypothetical protein
MKIHPIAVLLLLSTMASCRFESANQTEEKVDASDSTEIQATGPESFVAKCEIKGKVIDGNQITFIKLNRVIYLSATSETQDINFGDSHRHLVVLDGRTCAEIFSKNLPVNRSPDFPYYLSEINYNNLTRAVAIRGFDQVYVLDLENLKLSKALKPAFLNTRMTEDAQSGMITRMEVWENYLIGHASGKGAFVFDLNNLEEIKSVLPVAEYEIDKGTNYSSLFLLHGNDSTSAVQALMPVYDEDNAQFALNPLFAAPLRLQTNVNQAFRNNPFLVLKALEPNGNGSPLAIDMKKMKLIDLPENIQHKKDTEIIQWLKRQNQG